MSFILKHTERPSSFFDRRVRVPIMFFFSRLSKRLSAFFRVILMDNRGVGQTKDSDVALSSCLFIAS